MEPLLAGVDVSEKRTFTYSDSAGVHWLVATSPCLVNTDFETSQTTPALVMLVFSQWDSATAYLPVLRRNIDSTTDQIYFSTGIITAAVFVLMLCYVAIFVSWFTAPLTKMRQILSQVIEIAAEDENKRDYSAVVSVAWFDPKRSDELGYLATSFWYMIMQLHNSNEAKKSRPKHPANPFHLPTEVFLFGDSAPLENAASTQAVVGGRSAVLDKSSATGGPIRSTAASAVGPPHPPTSATTSDLMTLFLSPTTEQLVTPEVFLEQLNRHIASSAVNGQQSALDGQGQQGAVVESQPAAAIVGTEGDILAQLSAQFAMPDEGGAQSLSAMEMGKISPATPTRPEDSAAMATTTGVTAYAAVSTAEQVSAQPARVRSCQVFTLKVYLYGLSFLLLASLIAIMGAAVYLLQSEGESWMYETGDSVEAAEMLNLLTITETKSDFVMVRILNFGFVVFLWLWVLIYTFLPFQKLTF